MGDNTQTSAVYTRAVDKIRDEMAKSKAGYVQAVGEALTEYLQGHPESAEALLAKDKTIAGAVKAVEDEARKNKTGNLAVVDPARGYEIIMGYFGIDAKVTVSFSAAGGEATSSVSPAGRHLPLKGKAEKADPFDLDALLAL